MLFPPRGGVTRWNGLAVVAFKLAIRSAEERTGFFSAEGCDSAGAAREFRTPAFLAAVLFASDFRKAFASDFGEKFIFLLLSATAAFLAVLGLVGLGARVVSRLVCGFGFTAADR